MPAPFCRTLKKTDASILKIRTGSSSKRKMSVYHYAVQEFMNLHSEKVPVNTVLHLIKKYRETFCQVSEERWC
ncbi:MAG: hypothetical protein V4539_05615 [Bacteroidota bacterium]